MLELKETKRVFIYENKYSRVYLEFYDDEPTACYLTHLYVFYNSRRHGHGTETLLECESIAKSLGADRILLQCLSDSWVRHWYEEYGYKLHKQENEQDIWLIKML